MGRAGQEGSRAPVCGCGEVDVTSGRGEPRGREARLQTGGQSGARDEEDPFYRIRNAGAERVMDRGLGQG